MISGQILQNALEGIRSITMKEICVIDRDGKELAATVDNRLYDRGSQDAIAFFSQTAESQLINGCQYFKVFDNGIAEYVVLVRGEDEETYRIGKMTAFHIQDLVTAYKERFDRDNFIKNLLLDNLLLVDIYSRAKKLAVENSARRVVYIIETETTDHNNATVIDLIKGIFRDDGRDFVTAVDNQNVILVKELKYRDDSKEIDKIAASIHEALTTEGLNGVYVASGTPVNDLKLVSGSYKEAQMALEVGKIFDPKKNVINYEKLGIGRLIYHLPKSLCRMFVSEVLSGSSIEQIDDETIATVNEFFKCNLNISETARNLMIHRNTLVYRLDRLQKITRLDLRVFDDAVVFYITLMVTKFMYYKNKKMS